MRRAAGQASRPGTVWYDSNWGSIQGRQSSILLHEFCEDQIGEYRTLLEDLCPHIVFIGSMSLSFPGAIQYASLAKAIAKEPDDVLVVLGGKHCNETIGWKRGRAQSLLECSPARLIERAPKDGGIGAVFDVCVSGEAEEVVTALGEMVEECLRSGRRPGTVRHLLDDLPRRAAGEWVVSALGKGGACQYLTSQRPMDLTDLPTAPSVFGVRSRFSVFDATLTGHAYSDMGRGCAFDCFFCSERRKVNGTVKRIQEAPARLLEHFADIKAVSRQQGTDARPSAFVEDSILLGGNTKSMAVFAQMLLRQPEHQMPFGIQLTVDFLRRDDAFETLRGLRDVGLTYVAMGVETMNEHLADQMDKHARPGPVWTAKTAHAMGFLANRLNLNIGIYVMWGWGEDQELRERMLSTVAEWQEEYKQPCVVSLNWLTRHPLSGLNHLLPKPSKDDFVTWGTPGDSPYLPLFVEAFGEASVNYCLPSGDFRTRMLGMEGLAATPAELELLIGQYRGLELKQGDGACLPSKDDGSTESCGTGGHGYQSSTVPLAAKDGEKLAR
jgi:radical SAM superfamily enzyme YgiQ (UPF0313 family)